LNFDASLPQYKTTNGVFRQADPTVVHSSPLMWAEALDLLFQQMKNPWPMLLKILILSTHAQVLKKSRSF
jgi:hypothetical protein